MARPREFDEDDVVQKATEVFHAKGYRRTTPRDLLDATGLSKSSLYATFGNKQGLFLRAIERYADENLAAMRACYAEGSLRACLERQYAGLIEATTCKEGAMSCLMCTAAIEVDDAEADVVARMAQQRARFEAALTERIARAQREGELDEDRDPQAVARFRLQQQHGHGGPGPRWRHRRRATRRRQRSHQGRLRLSFFWPIVDLRVPKFGNVMENQSHLRTVLVTGGNKGIGFEAARQLAETGRWRVVISARSPFKAKETVKQLEALTGATPGTFGFAVFDNNRPATIQAAIAKLQARGERFDAVVLNAGGMAVSDEAHQPRLTEAGLSEMFATNVAGHALLVDELQHQGMLAEGATVMFAGSEVSRGIPVLGFASPTLPDGHGDLGATLHAVAAGAHAGDEDYDPMTDYGLVKLIGAVWMRQLRDRHGLRALTVSPGFTTGINVLAKLPGAQRAMVKYFMLPMLRFFGTAHDQTTGAARYVQALEDESLEAGAFYASPKTKLGGPLTPQDPHLQPLLESCDFEVAVGRLIDDTVALTRIEPIFAIAS